MKKLLAVLLTAAMTMAMLTACGSSNTEATDTTTETTEAEWSIGLKRIIGVDIFNKIARENTHEFLNL